MAGTRRRIAVATVAPNAKLCHLVHGSPQDGDYRLDRRPDRGRNAVQLGRLGLQRRIQAARFRFPGSLRPARNQIPRPVRRHGDDRLQGRRRGRVGGGQAQDGGRLRQRRQAPPRQRSRQSLRRQRHRRGQQRRPDRLRDGPVRHDQQQNRERRPQEARLDQPRSGRQRSPGRGRRPAGRGNPRRRRRWRLLLRDRAAGRDRDPAADLRLGGGDGPAVDHRPVRARRRPQPGHGRHPRLRHRRVRAAAWRR